jgi:hypothetical protein
VKGDSLLNMQNVAMSLVVQMQKDVDQDELREEPHFFTVQYSIEGILSQRHVFPSFVPQSVRDKFPCNGTHYYPIKIRKHQLY